MMNRNDINLAINMEGVSLTVDVYLLTASIGGGIFYREVMKRQKNIKRTREEEGQIRLWRIKFPG